MAIPDSLGKKKQNHLLNIFLMVSVSVVCVVGIELFCYLYLKIPAHMPSIVYFDPSQNPPKRLMPNANVVAYGPYREFRYRITTDANGFRRTYPFTENEKTYSLAILGDSQSFGVGVEDDQTFASLLAKSLNTSVLNSACPGYNTIEEFWTYKNRVKQFKPRHVLLIFFSGNDPYENYKNRALYDDKSSESESRTLVQEKQNSNGFSFLQDLKKFLSKHSAIYDSLIKLRQFPQFNQFLYRYQLVKPTPPSELAIFKKNDNPQAMDHWKITEQIIRKLRDEVESDGSKFWVVFIPDHYQVDQVHWQQWLAKYNLNIQDYDLMLPNRLLAKFSRENGIDFLDTTEILYKTHNSDKKVYWSIDNHLNVLGNQAIADFLTSHLSVNHHESISNNK